MIDAPPPGGDRPSGEHRTYPPAAGRRSRHGRDPGWRSPDVVRAAALVIGFYLCLRLLWFARPLVLLTFLGILFGVAIAAGVDRLQRWRIPRGVGAALIVLGTLGTLGGVVAWSAPTLRAQSQELKVKFPQALDKLDSWLESHQSGVIGSVLALGRSDSAATTTPAAAASTPAAQAPVPVAPRDTALEASGIRDAADGSELRRQLVKRVAGTNRMLFPFITSSIAAVGAVIYLIFLSVYVASEPDVYHSGIMHLVPLRARRRTGEVLSAIAIALRRWLVTQLIAMVVIGTISTIILLALRIPAAVPLGILAGFFEFIPTAGPILSAIPAVAMGFIDSPQKALMVAVAYVGVQFLENHLLIPLLMRRGVDLPPALTIVSQALMALVFGFLGLLVAVPALAATMVAVRMVYVEGVIGDEVDVLDAGREQSRTPATAT